MSKNEFRVIKGIIIFTIASFPQWISGVWYLFSTVPPYQWIQQKGITMPHFSLLWITWPIGLIALAILVRNSINEKKIKDSLQIESVICDKIAEDKRGCWVKIINPSMGIPAKNLKVELVKIEPVPSDLDVSFPVRLNPKEKDSNIINPKDSSLFIVFLINDEWSKIKVELLANGVVKVFSFEMLSNFVKGKKSQAEYLLTIAASADYFARVERSFKMIISGEPEWKIEFYSYE